MSSLLVRCILLIVCLLGLLGGGLLVFFGWQQRLLFVKSSPSPVAISLADLVNKGAGDQVHYEITDFTMGSDFVTQENRKGNVTRAWVPLFTDQRPSGAYRTQVVLLTSHLRDPNEEEIGRYRASRKTVTGLIVNDVQSLGSQERSNLEDHYPQADFSEVLLLEEDREPPTAGLVYGLLGGGGGLVFLGVLCGALALIFALRSPKKARKRSD